MRIILKKEKFLIIIAISLFLLVAAFLVMYFFKDKISLNLTSESFDRHGEYLSDCDALVKGGEFIYKCTAFINSYDRKDDGSECFDLSLVTKGHRLKKIILCEESSFIKWNPETMLTTLRVPVDILFSYSKASLGKYSLDKLSFELIKDDEILKLLNTLYEQGNIITNVRIQSNLDIIERGYYSQEINGINSVSFIDIDIERIYPENSNLFLEFRAKIHGQNIPFKVYSKELFFLRETEEDSFVSILNPENFVDIDLSKKYELTAYFIPKNAKIPLVEFLKNCSAGNYKGEVQVICNNIQSRNISELEVDIDDFIKTLPKSQENNPEELTFFFIVTND